MSQLADLVQMRPDLLPNLKYMHIGTDDEYYIHQFDNMLAEKNSRVSSGNIPLEAQVGGGKLATVFDTVLPSRYLPDVKWFGHKYSVRWRKPDQVDRALDKITESNRNGDTGATISDILKDDPELLATLRKEHPRDGPVYYYGSDEEVPEKDLHYMFA